MIPTIELRSLVRTYRTQFEMARQRDDGAAQIRFANRVDRTEHDLHLAVYGVPPWVEGH